MSLDQMKDESQQKMMRIEKDGEWYVAMDLTSNPPIELFRSKMPKAVMGAASCLTFCNMMVPIETIELIDPYIAVTPEFEEAMKQEFLKDSEAANQLEA